MFKIGDLVRVKPGGLDIWVHTGKVYTVLDVVVKPKTPADICYRNCGHPSHDEKPEKTYLTVWGEFNKPTTILSLCFESLDSPYGSDVLAEPE